MKASAVFSLLLLLSITGCGKKREEPVRPPGLLDSQGRPLNLTAPAPEPLRAAPPPSPDPGYDFERAPEPGPGALTAAPTAVQTATGQPSPQAPSPAEAKPPRDLSAELSSQLGRVQNCIDLAKAAAQPDGRLVVSVDAYVLGTGRVSRATIDAPGQPDTSRACVEREVLAVRLPADVPNAPLRVTASTEIRVKATAPPDAGVQGRSPGQVPTNPDIAQPERGDVAKPETPDLAGPP